MKNITLTILNNLITNEDYARKVLPFIKKDYFQEKKGKQKKDVTNLKFKKKINNIENEKIKKSLIELTKVFREK